MINKKVKFITIVLFVICFSLPIFAQEHVYVSVEKADLKEGTGFFSKKITEVEYGTKLLVLENSIEDKWIKVAEDYNDSSFGWILSSNVTKRKITNIFDKSHVTEKQIALAGKGFSEDEFYSEDIDYETIDAIEKIATNIDLESLKKFIKEGNLKGE